MKLGVVTVVLSLLIVAAGWFVADLVDERAYKTWAERSEREGAALTETFALTIERASARLYAFSRGLGGAQVIGNEGFGEEVGRLGLLVGEAPFRVVAFARRVPAEDRPALESDLGTELTIVGEAKTVAPHKSESFAVTGVAGLGDLLRVGTDMTTDPVLESLAVGGFRSPAEQVIGPSVEGGRGGLYTPISVKAEWNGQSGIVLGLFDFRGALVAMTRLSLPQGLGITVEERAAAVGGTVFRPVFELPGGDSPELTFRTRYSQGDVGWRFNWSVHENYSGGPDHEFGRALRWGGVAAAILLASILLLFELTRRRDRALIRQTDLHQTLIESLEEGITVVAPDMTLAASNERFLDLYDFPAHLRRPNLPVSEFVKFRLNRGDFGDVDDRGKFLAERQQWLTQGAGDTLVEELPDGRSVEIHRSRTADGHLVSLYLDVTEARRSAETFRSQSQLLQASLDNMQNGILVLDDDDRILAWNDRLLNILDIAPETMRVGKEAWPIVADLKFLRGHGEELVGESDMASHLRALVRGLIGTEAVHLSNQRWVEIALRQMPSGGFVFTFTDVTDRKVAEDKLLHDALYDTVTGLPNRALFLDRLGQVLTRWKRERGDGFAVLFLDLDRFKAINDSLGHDVGDILLVEVARRLESTLGVGDTLARLAGDEFGILTVNAKSRDDVIEAVHWLQSDLSAAFRLADHEVFTSVSIGISMPSEEFNGPEDMLRAADIAMYRAKDKGHSSYEIFDPQMQTRAITQLQLESDLRRAIEREEMTVHYQPVVDLRTGRVVGFESLARWQSMERGMVQPGQFIPTAEDTGLVVPIGTAALKQALRQMREWRSTLGALAPETISVNLSTRQLVDSELVREIELLLAQANVPGSCLKLEVTESMIMHNPEQTARTLMELKDLGVALSIDDFGTGYSSLSYLHRFPFDTLKVDRSFVVSMEEKRESREIIRTIALLAHTLDMDIIAEGVENERQLRGLVEFNCEYGQGFYFAKPMSAEEATVLLKSDRRWPAAADAGPRDAAE